MTFAKRRADAGNLPFVNSRIYTDPQIFEEEQRRIFRRSWLLVVHESELPEPLDFRTTQVAREPLAIIRGEDGVVRAFLNVCPHRGALLLRQPAGNLRQLAPSGGKAITCMFHAWQFNAQGECVAIPRRKAGYQDRLQCADVPLRRVACQVGFGGFVWVQLDADPINPPPLAAELADAFADLLPHIEAEPLEIFHHHKAVIDTNYKLWHETNSEFYHDYMHHFNRVTSMQQSGYFDRRYVPFTRGHVGITSMQVQYTAYEHGREVLAEDRVQSFPGLAQNGWKLLDVFPGITINLRGSALRVDTVTPLSADKVVVEFRGLGLRSDTPEQRAQRVRDHNTIWGPFGRNLPEDLLGVVGQARGMLASREPLHVLHARREEDTIHDEVGLRHYYREWSKRMGRSSQDPYAEAETRTASPALSADAE